MRLERVWICLVLLALLLTGSACTRAPQVDVVVGSAAPELERFAARELCDYSGQALWDSGLFLHAGSPARPTRCF